QAADGPETQPCLAGDWADGYRSDGIADRPAAAVAAGAVDVAARTRLQVDDRIGFAAPLVPALLAAPTAPLSRDERAARDLLSAWDFHQPADGEPGTAQARSSAAAAYFNAVWRHLLALLFDARPDDVR